MKAEATKRLTASKPARKKTDHFLLKFHAFFKNRTSFLERTQHYDKNKVMNKLNYKCEDTCDMVISGV